MTKIFFPETFFQYDKNNFKKNLEDNIILNELDNKIDLFQPNYIEKSELTIHLEDFLEFLLNKNIQIELPSQVQVKYFDFNRLEQLKYYKHVS
jgi:hypothetical protein